MLRRIILHWNVKDWAVHKFRMYLYGRLFVLQTDHMPLVQLNRSKFTNGRVTRWAMYLQNYNIHLQSIKGADNHFADFLSRAVY